MIKSILTISIALLAIYIIYSYTKVEQKKQKSIYSIVQNVELDSQRLNDENNLHLYLIDSVQSEIRFINQKIANFQDSVVEYSKNELISHTFAWEGRYSDKQSKIIKEIRRYYGDINSAKIEIHCPTKRVFGDDYVTLSIYYNGYLQESRRTLNENNSFSYSLRLFSNVDL